MLEQEWGATAEGEEIPGFVTLKANRYVEFTRLEGGTVRVNPAHVAAVEPGPRGAFLILPSGHRFMVAQDVAEAVRRLEGDDE